ncbi:MAG: NAD(P)-binding protein [Candidatus Aenigmarchaeota archaeon]|nr:NAD(P)-binding protein [Candidatus Aenigmarchaeota archaeon]NIP40189.1 NAD(P)-binding protein [Candidatus Aenigmarchaeota archaeon]NIQ17226.1 NAD(P)-binding protein [Candidatus Aenigmarchaeota archaeon]NIS73016.1 NAD(P)-binding protein [Candidatus Aenigmarchaeota archaeon]
MTETIKIAGAGISGLTAAINLAKNGYDVTVYEKDKSFTRDNICAVRNYDLTEDALEEFGKFGVELRPQSKVNKVIKFSPTQSIEEHSKKTIFYIFERGPNKNSIENQLYRQAKDLDVKISMGEPVNEKDVDIVATGGRRMDIFAYGHIYSELDTSKDTAYIIYDNLYAPKGYIYILTANGRTVIVSVSFDRKKFRYLPVNFSIFLRKNNVIRDLVGREEPVNKISGFGNYDIVKNAKEEGRYHVGERGFFMDASKGFGIRYAVITGHLASESIAKNLDYNKLWKRVLKEELDRNFKRRILLNRFANKDYDLMLKKIGGRVDIEAYIKETRKLKKHIDLFFPLYAWKWKLGKKISI